MRSFPDEAYQQLRKFFDKLRVISPRNPSSAALARERFLACVEAMGPLRAASAPARPSRALAWAVASIMVSVALLLTGTGVAYASQNALPADLLYPVKIAIEDLQLNLSSDDAVEAYLLLQFSQRRVNEVQDLVEQDRLDYLVVSVAGYNDNLQKLIKIINDYIGRSDPLSRELISRVAMALADHEKSFSALLETVPASSRTDIEVAIRVSESASQNPVFVERVAEFRGTLDDLSDQRAVICGVAFSLSPVTYLEGLPLPGDSVKVEFGLVDNEFVATKLEREEGREECELRVEGLLSQKGDMFARTAWMVVGIDFLVDQSTELRGDPQVGMFVTVRAVPRSDGSFVATRIETEAAPGSGDEDPKAEIKDIEPDKGQRGQTLEIEITGENTHFNAASVVTFNPSDGIVVNSIVVNSPTSLMANITVDNGAALGDRQVTVTTVEELAGGESFKIEGGETEGGSDEDEGDEEETGQARIIDVDPNEGQLGQTLTIVIVAEGTHFNTNSRVDLGAGITIYNLSVQSATELMVSISIASNAPVGDRSVSVTTGTEIAGGKEFRIEDASGGESGGGEQNGEDDDKQQEPEEEEQAQEVRFVGVVQSISGQAWVVDGEQVEITVQTEIKDEISVGDSVEVRALRMPDGSLVAEQIELAD